LSENHSKSKRSASSVAPYIDLGLRFALAILIGTGGGYWLDSKLGTTPLFLIIGVFLGATSGFMTIYRAVYPQDSTKTKKDE
jgi:F0F1-type ATP synthase assembly protein I